MKLIVGLGNPGKKYQKTRHNVGFMVIDCLQSAVYSQTNWVENKKFSSAVCKPKAEGLILAKPQTFVNQSGEAVAKIVNFYKIKPEDILVIRDDLDLEFGKVRGPRNQTGSGGHKGAESVACALGNFDFYQLKIGIGHPSPKATDGKPTEAEKYVLGNFSQEEWEKIYAVLDQTEKVKEWLEI